MRQTQGKHRWWLLLLLPYAVGLYMMEIDPGPGTAVALVAGLGISVGIPALFHRFIADRVGATALSLLFAPCVLLATVCLSGHRSGEAEVWLPLFLIVVLLVTSPAWIAASFLLGLGKPWKTQLAEPRPPAEPSSAGAPEGR